MIRACRCFLAARGHVQRVLRRQQGPYHLRYDRLLADQRERMGATLRNIRYEKCAVAKELSNVHAELASLFNPDRAQQLLSEDASSTIGDTTARIDQRDDINEAYRIYRLIRPEAPNFFEEQSFIGMKDRMDRTLEENQTECFTELVPIDSSLDTSCISDPLFTDEDYASAMYALMDSISTDIARLSSHLGAYSSTPQPGDHYDRLCEFLGLKRDGSNVDYWSGTVWPSIKPLLAPEFDGIDSKDISTWLSAHLERVGHNRAIIGRSETSEWYDIKRDLPYDGLPYPENLLDERRVGYPLDRACGYLMGLLQLLHPAVTAGVTRGMLDDLLDSLRKIGLKDWFGLRNRSIVSTFFGESQDISTVDSSSGSGAMFPVNIDACVKLLGIFAHGREHELDAEYWSPSAVFMRAGILSSPQCATDTPMRLEATEPVLSQSDLEFIVSMYSSRVSTITRDQAVRDCNRVFDRMIEEELEFQSSVGAGTVENNTISYKVPAGAQFDPKRNYYVRTKEGIDPTLKLDNLRSCVLERRRMRTMTKEGRVYFLRIIVAVGDGRGYFGTGVGFGNDVGTARASAVQQALRNMYFIDYDPKEPLTTPVLGQEYGCRVYIKPRKMGSGIRTNRKYLPLVYLIGLDNCRVTFHGRKSWLTRAKALRKALEQIYSRRTMCNATGQRYVYIGSPGDHTVHWPDNWFMPISKEYKAKTEGLKNLKRVHFRRHLRRVVLPEEVIPEVPSYSAHKFRSPLEVLEQERVRSKWISTSVPKAPRSNATEQLPVAQETAV